MDFLSLFLLQFLKPRFGREFINLFSCVVQREKEKEKCCSERPFQEYIFLSFRNPGACVSTIHELISTEERKKKEEMAVGMVDSHSTIHFIIGYLHSISIVSQILKVRKTKTKRQSVIQKKNEA